MLMSVVLMHSERIPDSKHDGRPDAELRTCLVNLNVTSRAELICLQEGNDASFTNCSERRDTCRLGLEENLIMEMLRLVTMSTCKALWQCHISRDEERLAHVASVNTKDTGL